MIGVDALGAVVRAVHANHDTDGDGGGGGREMMRPENMAPLSPWVFWSLWFRFHRGTTAGDPATTRASIEEALVRLRPELDRTLLRGRSRELSAKA